MKWVIIGAIIVFIILQILPANVGKPLCEKAGGELLKNSTGYDCYDVKKLDY
jgi:hypothetical protein